MTQQDTLFQAISKGEIEQVRAILATSPSLASSRNDVGVSALLWALYHSRSDAVGVLRETAPTLTIFEAAALDEERELLRLIADDRHLVEAISPDGFTPLHLAAFFGQAHAAAILIEHGAQVDACSKNGADLKPINSAAACRDLKAATEVVAHLIRSGADVAARQRGGFTALHSAAANGNVELVQLLLESGAPIGALSDDGKTAIDFAKERSRGQVVQLLSTRQESIGRP